MAKLSKRIIKTPKVYFMDTGLCAYLCKWPTAEIKIQPVVITTFVLSNLIAL